MFGDSTSSNLFAGISSTNGPSLFPTQTSSSLTSGSLFFPSSTSSSTLFGLSPTPLFSSPRRSEENTPVSSYTDLDAPISERRTSSSFKSADRSPTHWPAIKLSRLPAGFNRKPWIQQHFERFGTVTRIVCQPSLDVAYVAFENAASAQNAKRYGHAPPSSQAPHEALPSTVLLTLAQCRMRPRPETVDQEVTSLQITDPRSLRSKVKRKLSPLNNERPLRKAANQPRPTFGFFSQDPNETKPFSTLFPSNGPGSTDKPIQFANTVEERASVLQAHYTAERERKPVLESHHLLPTELVPSDMGNSEDYFDLRFPAIRGTCPDMCPELERYLREAHQRVSVFECLPSSLLNSSSSGWQMDHTRAVKDYERSSADQPVPLPRELRPTPVLQRTMAYLLASIADRPELDTTRSLWKPWYEFMWTRTRAIRKDVAQQRLCCPVIVNVMECIARFHIFCAARLVDQSIDSFDPRINSENLTQCLQTLKELYNDLAAAQPNVEKTLCPHEAVFRAYMLLMNLNDQGALNDVQKLPPHLLRSPEIRFAVAVHESVTTNNYIRFFRLAHQATCLVACLMHRYFVQMRSQALIRLATSFAGHPKKDIQYPLSTITRQLAFEDTREAKAFCEHWGLTTTDEYVIFDKQTPPQPPELPWRERRALSLIEQKRSGIPLSNLFHNGPVSAEHAQPPPVQSSFDQNGRFICLQEDESDQVNADATSAVLGTTSETQLVPLPTHSQELAALAPEDRLLMTTLSNSEALMGFLLDWLNESLDFHSIARECLVEETVLNLIVDEFIDQLNRTESAELAQQMLHGELRSIRSEIVLELRDTLITEVLREECHQLARTCSVLDSLYRELFEQEMLPSIIASVAYASLLSAQADAFHRCCLVRSAFKKLCAYMRRKREDEERDRALIRSMPACPALGQNALTMLGLKIWDLVRFESSPSALNTPLSPECDHRVRVAKRARFSIGSAKADEKLTWQAIPSSALSISSPLGICVCSTSSEFYPFSRIVLAWIRAKLAHFQLVSFHHNSRDTLSINLAAVLCVGYPDELFSQFISEHRLHALVFVPSKGLPDEFVTLDSSTLHFLALPCTPSGEFIPTLTWAPLLHDGLRWLQLNLSVSPGSKDEPPQFHSTLAAKRMDHIRLGQFVSQLIDFLFFRPLTTLSRLWHNQGLVDPSPVSLFNLYRSVLKRLSDEAPRISKFDVVHSALQVPDSGLKFLNGVESWNSLFPQFSLLAQHLRLSSATNNWVRNAISQSERVFQRSVGRPTCLPLPVLAPWLHICVATVHDLLDRWAYSDTGHQPIPPDILECWLPLLSITNEELLLHEMTQYFLQSGQPCMSYTNAIALSLQSDLRHHIASSLVMWNSRSPTTPSSKTTDPVRPQLDALCARMRTTEVSMKEALNETLSRSKM